MSNTITPTVVYRTLNVEGLEIFYREAGARPFLQSPQAQESMQSRYFRMDMPRINVEDARAVGGELAKLGIHATKSTVESSATS